MRNYRHIYVLLAIALWWQLPQAAGQGWRQTYGIGSLSETWQAVAALPAGGFALAGHSDGDLYFAIVDNEGEPISTSVNQIGDYNVYVAGLTVLPSGEILAGGTFTAQDGAFRIWLGRFNTAGELINTSILTGDSHTGVSMACLDNNIGIAGGQVNPDNMYHDAFLLVTDSVGNILWEYDSDNPNYDTFTDIAFGSDSSLWALGYRSSDTSETNNLLLMQFSISGELLLEKEIDLGGEELTYKLALTQDGNLAVVLINWNGGLVQVAKINPEGQLLWLQNLTASVGSLPTDIAIDENDNILSLVNYIDNTQPDYSIKLFVTHPSGQLSSAINYGLLGVDISEGLYVLPDSYLLFGSAYHNGERDAMLIRTDSLARLYTASVSGQVYRDQNADCMADPGEPMLSAGIIVKAEPQQGGPVAYTVTDIDGHYNLFLDTGLYLISVLPPNNLWQTCTNDIAIYLPEHDDSLTVDFGLQALVDCPAWEVEAATPFLRRCFDNNYAIRYCNTGTVASDGTVQVVLDPYFSYAGSSLPLTAQSGDTLLFAFDSLDVFECRQMTLQIHLDCDSTMLGQTHCLETRILPDTVCTPPPAAWDGADLQMAGVCLGDSVMVAISNTGAGDMSVASQYLVIEDQIMLRTGEIQLLSGQDTTLVFYPEGATLIVLVDQTPNHPDDEPAIVVIEGCGAPPFSTGFALQFPYGDSAPNFDIECRQNIGSYDPNAKSALPQGYGEDRRIATGTTIDYLIQFQNVGTDTAFRVVIRDTLSPWLDPETLRMGVASHDYTWKIVNDNTLKIVFDPIALPDSSVNEAGSNGFVKFSVKLKDNTPIGASINNRAGIYFDFNAPVITNTVSHTVGIEWLVNTTDEPAHTAGRPGLHIYPNPMGKKAQIDWSDGAVTSGELRLFDLNGRCRWHSQNANLPFTLYNPGLPPGYYIVVLYQNQQLVSGAKLIVR
ncbi:MAG: T9SS type A sorting domain-containing protein [Saprospiraceae bacterium]|nr:T9SS type A sorting domain-containing protein [Saprospiraceae bacterium]